jgi:hypothetical protein
MKECRVNKKLVIPGLEYKDVQDARIYDDEKIRAWLLNLFKSERLVSVYLVSFTHYSPEKFIKTQEPFQ